MSQPDLSTLPKRMRYAATVQLEALERARANKPRAIPEWWTANILRHWADRFEDEDRAAAERSQEVEELARTMFDAVAQSVSTFEWDDDRNRWNRDIYREAARGALAAGWTKAPL